MKASKNNELKKWDKNIPVLIKRIKNPIPMYVKLLYGVELKRHAAINKTGKVITESVFEYDLVKGDMLPPFGKGEVADIKYNWRLTINSYDDKHLIMDYMAATDITTINYGDGIVAGILDKSGSKFVSNYQAPENGYTTSFNFYRKVINGKTETNDDKHPLYYFRIRTVLDDSGNVKSALYGKIYGQLNGTFTYYLNPTPNDRNVEPKAKTNVFGTPLSFDP